jgi:hypothetical protein
VRRAGLISSINAAYTPEDVQLMLQESSLKEAKVRPNILGFVVTGQKTPTI